MATIDPPEGEASEAEAEGIDSFKPFLVHSADGTVVADYPVGVFLIGDFDATVAIPTVVVTIIDSQLLVAVPGTAWHRLRNSRQLPPDCLQRPIAISVAGVKELDREIVEEGIDIKVWLGLLKNSYLPCLSFDSFDADHFTTEFKTEQGDSGYVPFADGLVAAADEKFSFLTAGEGSGQEEARMGPDIMTQRISKLEENMVAIKMTMDKLVKASSPPLNHPPQAVPLPKAPPARAGKSDGGFPGLDPQAVQAALASGIDASHLQELSKMLVKDKPKLGDAPGARARQPKKVDILGDSEEEEGGADAEEVAAPPDGDPVSVAVVKLTNIMSSLTKKKKPRSFEELLDDTSGILDQSSSSSTMGGSRKHATLLRNLRKAMRESPRKYLPGHRESHGKRLWCSRNCPRIHKTCWNFQRMDGTPFQDPKSWCHRPHGLDDSRCSRQFASGKSGGGSGEIITFPLSTGPGGSGSWPVGACSGGGCRGPPSVLLFQSSCTSRSIGTPTYPFVANAVGRSLHASSKRAKRVHRKTPEAGEKGGHWRRICEDGRWRGKRSRQERKEERTTGGGLSSSQSIVQDDLSPPRMPAEGSFLHDISEEQQSSSRGFHPSTWWCASFRFLAKVGGDFAYFVRSFHRRPATTSSSGRTARMWPLSIAVSKTDGW